MPRTYSPEEFMRSLATKITSVGLPLLTLLAAATSAYAATCQPVLTREVDAVFPVC